MCFGLICLNKRYINVFVFYDFAEIFKYTDISLTRCLLHQYFSMPLADNRPHQRFTYKISVQTGWKSGAGSDANVFFQLYGEETETDPRVLTDGKLKVIYAPCTVKICNCCTSRPATVRLFGRA